MKQKAKQFFILIAGLMMIGCMSPALEKASSNKGDGTTADGSADPSLSTEPDACPETIFPHPDNWGEVDVHGPCVVQIGILDCQQCHGQHLEGQAGPACSNCHHPDGWKEVSQHSKRFAFQLPTTNDTTCMICHGEDYSGDPVGVSCSSCHRLSHTSGWRQPQNHGARYCEQRGGDETNFCNLEGDQEANCFNCHSEPLIPDANYAGAAPATSPPPHCQQCHAVFPHRGYQQVDKKTGNLATFPWKKGHRMMLLNNNGLFPGKDLNDPALVEAIPKNCGDGGGCHTNGRFSLPKGNSQAACATVCHKQ